MTMERPVIVDLDDISMRFTPDGRVSVVDAIRAVGDVHCPTSIWERMKEAHPEILTYCEDYLFEEETPVAVINREGWDKVWLLLPDYLSDPNSMQHGI
jgi:hypothetical protein